MNNNELTDEWKIYNKYCTSCNYEYTDSTNEPCKSCKNGSKYDSQQSKERSGRMSEEEINEINDWFEEYKDFETYHQDEEYVISSRHLDEFKEFLNEHFTDLVYIQCYFNGTGIWFYKEDLYKAKFL